MVLFNLKVLAKFGHCSNCSQKLQMSVRLLVLAKLSSGRMLGFSIKFPYGKLEKHWGKLHAL